MCERHGESKCERERERKTHIDRQRAKEIMRVRGSGRYNVGGVVADRLEGPDGGRVVLLSSPVLTFTHPHSLSLSLSLSLSNTHTNLALSLSHTHTLSLSHPHSLSLGRRGRTEETRRRPSLSTFSDRSSIRLTNPPGHLWRDTWTALSGPLSRSTQGVEN